MMTELWQKSFFSAANETNYSEEIHLLVLYYSTSCSLDQVNRHNYLDALESLLRINKNLRINKEERLELNRSRNSLQSFSPQ